MKVFDVAETPCTLRHHAQSDAALIAQTWIRSMRISSDRVRSFFGAVVRDLIARGDLVVACPLESPGTIVGWAAFSGPMPLYVYVSEPFRRHGVASRLLDSKGKP